MSAAPLRIALAQPNLMVGDIAGNARCLIDWSLRARDELGAQVVVFPELALSGYPPEDLLLRREILDAVERAVERIARAVSGITVVFGLPERDAQGEAGVLYNAALALRDGQVIARAHKRHLPNYGVFDEKRWFEPGRLAAGAGVFEVAGVPLGLLICEDSWYPDPARALVGAGARVLLSLNASPYHRDKGEEREAVLRARHADTGATLVYVNLVGGQDELVFDGESFAFDSQGLRLRLPAFEEALGWVELETQGGAQGRIVAASASAPALTGEAEVYRALVLGVRDYARKNGFSRAVLGLSGGVDSALVLAIAVDALGADKVEAMLLPSPYTAPMSLEDARAQARSLGVPLHEIPITPAFETFRHLLADLFAGLPQDITEENLQARCRGVLLMALSNKRGSLLLTTGNKSEMAVGYCTLYGDMAGGFAPLKDVAKMQVYALARYRNREGEVIPERVLTRAPSAELRPDQRDEDSLAPYPVLDAILEAHVEQDRSVREIVALGYDEALVRRIVRLVEINEYKRRQAAPGVRVTRRAFGRDRRYPISSGFGRTPCED